jgi:hypothetical protein
MLEDFGFPAYSFLISGILRPGFRENQGIYWKFQDFCNPKLVSVSRTTVNGKCMERVESWSVGLLWRSKCMLQYVYLKYVTPRGALLSVFISNDVQNLSRSDHSSFVFSLF